MQLVCALAGLVLGLLLPRISFDAMVASSRVTDALVAVGFGVLGLVTVIEDRTDAARGRRQALRSR